MSATTCKNHPRAVATYSCHQCQSPLCNACVRTNPQGVHTCPDCHAHETPEALETLETDNPDATYDLANPTSTPAQDYRPSLSFGKPCKVHPDATAVAVCHQCRAGVCSTCDFPFPGGIHLCPACATNPKQGLTTKRKKFTYWSMGLGVASGMMLVVGIIAAVAAGGNEAGLQLGGCFICLAFPATVVGFVLGVTAFKKNADNPGILWVGPVINGLIIALYLLRAATMMLSGGQ